MSFEELFVVVLDVLILQMFALLASTYLANTYFSTYKFNMKTFNLMAEWLYHPSSVSLVPLKNTLSHGSQPVTTIETSSVSMSDEDKPCFTFPYIGYDWVQAIRVLRVIWSTIQ